MDLDHDHVEARHAVDRWSGRRRDSVNRDLVSGPDETSTARPWAPEPTNALNLDLPIIDIDEHEEHP
jgi:hypothetical protein